MRFLSVKGSPKEVVISKYKINWNGKSRSKFQMEVKAFLKKFWLTQVVCEEFPVVGTRQTIDFFNVNKRVAIEVDGVQHDKFNKFFHNNDRLKYAGQLIRDGVKEDWCERNGVTLVRIKPGDLPLSPSFFEKMGITL